MADILIAEDDARIRLYVAAALKEATARHREAARLFRALGQTAWRIVQEGVRSRPARSTGKSGEDRGRRRTGAKRSGS